LVITASEGTLTMKHFIENTSHPIYVAFEINSSNTLKSLRSQVQRGAQKGISIIILAAKLFGKSKIHQKYMSFLTEHDILRLEVPVNNFLSVDKLDSVN